MADRLDEPPQCECNVFDHTGKVIAWRTWACPLHKFGGWLQQQRAVSSIGDEPQ